MRMKLSDNLLIVFLVIALLTQGYFLIKPDVAMLSYKMTYAPETSPRPVARPW